MKKPGRPPPPQTAGKTEEKPVPIDSGSSGEESDDDQEQENLEEVQTKVVKWYISASQLFFLKQKNASTVQDFALEVQ